MACVKSQRAALDMLISNPSIHTVFMSARWPLYRQSMLVGINGKSRMTFDEALRKTVNTLISRDLNVIVVDSLPEPGFDVANGQLARKCSANRL